jgi:hypothetical protein
MVAFRDVLYVLLFLDGRYWGLRFRADFHLVPALTELSMNTTAMRKKFMSEEMPRVSRCTSIIAFTALMNLGVVVVTWALAGRGLTGGARSVALRIQA